MSEAPEDPRDGGGVGPVSERELSDLLADELGEAETAALLRRVEADPHAGALLARMRATDELLRSMYPTDTDTGAEAGVEAGAEAPIPEDVARHLDAVVRRLVNERRAAATAGDDPHEPPHEPPNEPPNEPPHGGGEYDSGNGGGAGAGG